MFFLVAVKVLENVIEPFENPRIGWLQRIFDVGEPWSTIELYFGVHYNSNVGRVAHPSRLKQL
jgi:hypothetical protein